MANPIKPRTSLQHIQDELTRHGFSRDTVYAIRQVIQRADKTATDLGEIQAQANVSGRKEQLSVTLQNITTSDVAADAGKLDSLAHVVDTSTDHLTDGNGSPLTGGKRGFNALDANNRLQNSFRNTAVNVSVTPKSSTVLSNDGVSTAIPVAASQQQFGAGAVSYNSGSVDPGSFGGPNFVFVDDPDFAGGAVAYQFSTDPSAQTAMEGLVPFGSITTVNGAGKTGGGSSGGTGGGSGGRGFIPAPTS